MRSSSWRMSAPSEDDAIVRKQDADVVEGR
jgi:hypothetical protein